MEAKHGSDPRDHALEELRGELDALRRTVAILEQRVNQLEVRLELWEEPSAAGDEPVRP